MKRLTIAIALFTLLLASACKNQSATTTNASAPASDNQATTSVAQNNLTPEELGELGAKIKSNPNDAQKILSERGLTQESFEKQVRQVAQDPEASKRYAAAYKRTS